MTTEQESKNLSLPINSERAITERFKGVPTLRSRLLISILPAVLIPFALASALGYVITERRAENQIVERLEEETITVSSTIATFIRNSFQTVNLITANPEVIQAMKAGNDRAEEQNLAQKTVAELEQEFESDKLLLSNNNVNNYLKKTTQSGQIAEVIITQSNGLNVASSNLTSDFVQRDETWWQITRERSLFMDEPDFDESANTTVIPFSQAVKDLQTGEFLGIIKAAIPISTLQLDLSSQFGKEQNESSRLIIVDPDEGFVLFDSKEEEMDIANDADDDDDEEEIDIANDADADADDEEEMDIANDADADDDDEEEMDDDDDDDDEEEMDAESLSMIGGKPILDIVETLVMVEGNSLSFEAIEDVEEGEINFLSLEEAQNSIAQMPGFSKVRLRQAEIFSEISTIASFRYQDKIYTLSTVPKTDFVSIDTENYEVVAAAARNLVLLFLFIAAALGTVSFAWILFLSRQISQPIANLSNTTQKAAAGNLDIEATPEGTLETRTLADSFNYLVAQTKASLQQQKDLAEEQRQAKEQLELAIYTLIDEVSGATDGDLTVRANLDSMELSTVADLFNAIIDNLQKIAVEARQSTGQVGSSLQQNERQIRTLAQQAVTEAEETRNTLSSVEQMSQSIQAVAANASQVEQIADDTYNTVLTSTSNMDSTVNSILNLRTTVGETSKKMKRLGESSQRISQAVSFIEEVALKTNILAINATVEAGRAGEFGQGFTIVAEQVAGLAEQSAAATKEIAQIVAEIQAETQGVNQAMESGTSQVVETTRLIESTKESLAEVLEKSQTIDRLIKSISQSTVSQADTSRNLTELMQKIARLSETTSQSSEQVAKSIIETAQIAQKLESAVAQFKVAEST